MIQISQLEERIHACWLGKNIGGTLGGPHEGKPGPLALDFYNPVPERVLPNDDLDLQVVWLYHLLQGGHRTVTPDILADAWRKHVAFPFDEYGIAHRNDACGFKGAARGAFDNYFAESMGAAIRSEIWACVAPGEPARAAALAWADAVVDHCGDGVLAEVFHAAIQSQAFIESEREKLISLGLTFLPDASRLKQGLLDTRVWWRELGEWTAVRERIVQKYATGNFTDVVCNLCFEILGWMAAGDDFGKAICIAVNCGLDTDCTGATLGALLGIINPKSIPEKWKTPIGEDVVLSPEIHGVNAPANLAELTAWTLRLREQLRDFGGHVLTILPRTTATADTGARSFLVSESASADENIFAAETPSVFSAAQWRESRAFGHWRQWRTDDFSTPVKVLKMRFHVAENEAVKLMTYYRPGLTAWVDGQRALALTEECLTTDTFAAPSFHRPGKSAVVFKAGALAAGAHELIIACRCPKSGIVADFVFGLANPATNQWLPAAFMRRE